jgi:hypothetical protein
VTCRFEPWWIGRRADISVYDSKYRGYGKNKVGDWSSLRVSLRNETVLFAPTVQLRSLKHEMCWRSYLCVLCYHIQVQHLRMLQQLLGFQ